MNEPQTRIYAFGEFRLDPAKRLLLKAGNEVVPLMPKAFDTLLYLVRNGGKIIEKDELMREIWADTIVEENNLNQNISILRKILGERRGEHRFIATVPGRGYKFVAEVREVFEEELENDESTKAETQNPQAETAENQKPNYKIPVFVGLILLIAGLSAAYFWRQTESKTPIKSIAVLPFKPLVAENRDEALEMGMADTLIARLDNNRGFIVRPLSSVRKFNNLEQDALQAGRELGVESVLDGNIQRWGDKIRVNVRLINIADSTSLYSGTFEEKFTDIFVVQDAISEKVAEALKIHLGGNEKTNNQKHDTKNIEAYRFYLQGRYHALKLTPPDIRKGIGFYQQAIDADPLYALAYTGMAYAYVTLPIASDVPPREAFPKAKTAAEKALEIDPELDDAYRILGFVAFWYEWDWKNSEASLKKAIRLNPNNAGAHLAYAHLLSNLGRHDEALAEIKLARELDRLTLITNSLEGMMLFYAGRQTEAIAQLNRTFEIEPNFWVARINLAKIYIEQKKFDEAINELQKAREFSGGNSETISLLGYALAKYDRRDEALKILTELKSAANEKYVPPYSIAMIYNGLGETNETIKWLERAFEDRDVRMTFLKVDPKWNSLRNDPRFIDLLRRMNFE